MTRNPNESRPYTLKNYAEWSALKIQIELCVHLENEAEKKGIVIWKYILRRWKMLHSNTIDNPTIYELCQNIAPEYFKRLQEKDKSQRPLTFIQEFICFALEINNIFPTFIGNGNHNGVVLGGRNANGQIVQTFGEEIDLIKKWKNELVYEQEQIAKHIAYKKLIYQRLPTEEKRLADRLAELLVSYEKRVQQELVSSCSSLYGDFRKWHIINEVRKFRIQTINADNESLNEKKNIWKKEENEIDKEIYKKERRIERLNAILPKQNMIVGYMKACQINWNYEEDIVFTPRNRTCIKKENPTLKQFLIFRHNGAHKDHYLSAEGWPTQYYPFHAQQMWRSFEAKVRNTCEKQLQQLPFYTDIRYSDNWRWVWDEELDWPPEV